MNTGSNLVHAYCFAYTKQTGFVTFKLMCSFPFYRNYLYLQQNLKKCVIITLMGKERPFDQ